MVSASRSTRSSRQSSTRCRRSSARRCCSRTRHGLQLRPERSRPRAAGRPSTRLYAKPPASTEQVLHPEKYAAGEAPVDVDLPDGPRDAARVRLDGRRSRTRSASSSSASGCEPAGKVPKAAATAAAAGWGGDRVVLARRPERRGASSSTPRWDTPADAAEFAAAAHDRAGARARRRARRDRDGRDGPGDRRSSRSDDADDAPGSRRRARPGRLGA